MTYQLMSNEVTSEKIKTREEIAELLNKVCANKWQRAGILSKIKRDGIIWITESMNWIFIYQSGILVCGVDAIRR